MLEAFLTAWPPERIRDMTLEEGTTPDTDDALFYGLLVGEALWKERPHLGRLRLQARIADL